MYKLPLCQLCIAVQQMMPKAGILQQQLTYCLTVCVDEESEQLGGWFWLKVSHKVLIKVSAGTAAS